MSTEQMIEKLESKGYYVCDDFDEMADYLEDRGYKVVDESDYIESIGDIDENELIEEIESRGYEVAKRVTELEFGDMARSLIYSCSKMRIREFFTDMLGLGRYASNEDIKNELLARI